METEYYVAKTQKGKEVPSSAVTSGQKDKMQALAVLLNASPGLHPEFRYKALPCK